MTFTQILDDFNILRERLVTIDSELVIQEIGINIPKNNNDELSFLRLVAWSYVLLYENAKIHVKFFNTLNNSQLEIPDVRSLRTYMAHNLSLDKSHDKKVIKKAHNWFKTTCNNIRPESPEEWEKCFAELAAEIKKLINALIQLCDKLVDEIDGQNNVDELKKRIQKEWEGYQFDEYIEKATQSLGYTGLNTVEFRNRHLQNWRTLIKTLDVESIDRLLTQRIESDLISDMSNALPFTLEELNDLLNLNNKEELQALVVLIKEEVRSGNNLADNLRQIAGDMIK